MQLFTSRNRAQSFWELLLGWGSVTVSKVCASTVSLYVNQMFLSPEWNWIPCSITTSAERSNGAQHTVCCVVAVFLILHCQLHLAAGVVEH